MWHTLILPEMLPSILCSKGMKINPRILLE